MYPTGGNVEVLSPFQVGSLRILIASLVLLPVSLKYLKLLSRRNTGYLLISGLAGNFIPAFLFTLAETHIDSSLAGLLNMSTTFFVTLIGIFVYRVFPSRYQLAGLLLGSIGLYLVLYQQIDFSAGDLSYALLVILATICYAISLTTIKFKLGNLPSLAITSLSFFLILFPAAIACLFFNSFSPVFSHPDGFRSIGYLSILSVVGTAVAVVLFTRLIAISSHIFSSAVAYVLPVVAVFLGVLDGDVFHPVNLIWIAIIFTGVYLMNKKQKNTKKAGAA